MLDHYTGLPAYISKASQVDSKNLPDIKSMSSELISNSNELKMIPDFVNHLSNLNVAPNFTFGDNYSFKNINLKQAYLYTNKNDANNFSVYFNHNAICTISSVNIIANGKIVGYRLYGCRIKDVIINNGRINGTKENCGEYNSFEEAQQAAKDFYNDSGYNVEPIAIK